MKKTQLIRNGMSNGKKNKKSQSQLTNERISHW